MLKAKRIGCVVLAEKALPPAFGRPHLRSAGKLDRERSRASHLRKRVPYGDRVALGRDRPAVFTPDDVAVHRAVERGVARKVHPRRRVGVVQAESGVVDAVVLGDKTLLHIRPRIDRRRRTKCRQQAGHHYC